MLTPRSRLSDIPQDFAAFLKKRAVLEEDQAQGMNAPSRTELSFMLVGMRKLCKATHETLRRPESRAGSYALQMEEMTNLHDRQAENGLKFSAALHHMHEELAELAGSMERGRKHWKQVGIGSEKRAQDAEQMAEKVSPLLPFSPAKAKSCLGESSVRRLRRRV